MRRPPFARFAILLVSAFLSIPAAAASPEPATADVRQPGLLASMRTFRGSHDILHIFGQTDRDALFALGRAHARDRFFQMDVLRRMFAGSLRELVGGGGPGVGRPDP